jgi:FixJ family two-component response regulator
MPDAAAVLIIDDDEGVRRAFRRVLAQAGLVVIEAEDGKAGLALCGTHAPGVVFLDLRMPDMDGLEVLSALNERHPETPVVVVSGFGTMNDAVEALRRGAWDFVAKPLDNELLVRAARRGIERSTLQRQNREYAQSLRRMNERLTVALSELVSSAIRCARRAVEVLVETSGSMLVVRVSDDRTVAMDAPPAARFVALEDRRDAALGWPLVCDVARAHGGELRTEPLQNEAGTVTGYRVALSLRAAK